MAVEKGGANVSKKFYAVDNNIFNSWIGTETQSFQHMYSSQSAIKKTIWI